MTHSYRTTLGFVFVLALGVHAGAQEPTQQVKDLYAAAAYEDALGVLSRLPKGSTGEMDRYRAFCLIALGRTAEAEKAIEEVVAGNPAYQPDPAEASPRVQELFRNTRRQVLPQVARRMYTDAKGAMARKESQAAVKGFEDLIQLLDDPALKSDPATSELQMLAAGFLELSRAMPAAEAQKPTAETAPAAPAAPPVITPPIAINQQLPVWSPSDGMSRRADFAGAIKLAISAEGKVESATMVSPIHPAYDVLLKAAAKAWTYHPARQNGQPVASEKVVQVRLRPK